MEGLRTVYLLLAKDLLVEFRTRETFTVMLFSTLFTPRTFSLR